MASTPLCVFVEELIQFCLDRNDITWQPAARVREIEDSPIVFYEAIGHALISTSITYLSIMQKYSKDILKLIFHKGSRERLLPLNLKVTEVALTLYRTDNPNLYRSANPIQSTFIFLTVMVDVSMKCALRGRQEIIQEFVRIIPCILNLMLPDGFLRNLPDILMFAHRHPQPVPESVICSDDI